MTQHGSQQHQRQCNRGDILAAVQKQPYRQEALEHIPRQGQHPAGKTAIGKGIGRAGVFILTLPVFIGLAEQLQKHPCIQYTAGQITGDNIHEIPIHTFSPFGRRTVKITAPPILSALTVPP